MLATALDAEELEDYNFTSLVYTAVNHPKGLKHWKWQSPDQAGTKEVGDPTNSVINLAASLTGGNIKATGTAEKWEKATGRVIGWMDDSGNIYTRSGELISKDDADMVLPMSRLEADG